MSAYGSAPGILSSFHSALDNIVKERFSDTFRAVGDFTQRSKSRSMPLSGTSRPNSDPYSREAETNMLTMGLIGCLPDNVQQAIKSFSIRPGKQHITFAFPFMEDTIRSFCDTGQVSDGSDGAAGGKPRYVTSVLFFDECLEVIHGFQTYVTVLPHLNKSSLPVVMLTLYQRDTSEGICRHFQSLMRILVEHRVGSGLWKLPTMVAELNSKYREVVLDACAESIVELQAESLCHTFPGKSSDQLIVLVKEKLLRPYLLSYPELLRRNTQEVVRNLTTTDPSYFLSLLELLQSPNCSILDFKKVDMMFKNPGIDPAIRELWKIWGHEQISRKVFPVTMATTPLSKLGPLYSRLGGASMTPSGAEAVVSVGSLSHVPVKEGLQSVIKCLKSQEISQVKPKEPEHEANLHSCNCSVCKIQPQTRRNSRLRLYGDFKSSSATSEGSAFHLPFHNRSPANDNQNYGTRAPHFRLPPSTLPYHGSLPSDEARNVRDFSPYTAGDVGKATEMTYGGEMSSVADRPAYSSSSVTSSRHVVQPVPHYFPINLKAFSQRVLYGYPMLNKPQYPLTLSSRPSL